MRDEFLGYIETETPKAILFQDHFWHAPDWMPKSQITILRSDGTLEVKVSASAWICEKKEIREFEERKSETA